MPSETVVRTESEFRSAVEKKCKLIRVMNATIAKRLKLMMAIPPASFVTAIAALGVAIAAWATAPAEIISSPLTGGASGIVRFGGGGGGALTAWWLIGGSATWALITLSVVLGGVGVVTYLFNNYRIKDKGANWVLLERIS